jgi:hypothetical protein
MRRTFHEASRKREHSHQRLQDAAVRHRGGGRLGFAALAGAALAALEILGAQTGGVDEDESLGRELA